MIKKAKIIPYLPSDGIYSVPMEFSDDLLNPFLLEINKHHTSGGNCEDYRFLYWGAKNSFTPLHTDVLGSYSWSYNVFGKKLWTFFEPGTSKKITFTQGTNECVFVPSMWQHKVENLEETISVNHNWVLPQNLTVVWNLIVTESLSIEDELKKWGTEDGVTTHEKENMLRSCCGLNVGMFFLMTVRGLVLNIVCDDNTLRNTNERKQLRDALNEIMSDKNLVGRIDKNAVDFASRLLDW